MESNSKLILHSFFLSFNWKLLPRLLQSGQL